LGFKLLAELGRGAFGTVFLAEQHDLARRPVALKVSRELLSESQTLAQLQHTNIVPIHSVHRAGRIQAICMPYFGSTTLADCLRQWKTSALLPLSGKAIADTVLNRQSITIRNCQTTSDARSSAAPDGCHPVSASSSQSIGTLNALSGLSYVDATLWIGARLADGLAHAHDRGILHRDLKPANVLLANDGQPMLLDFNLSQDMHAKSSATTAGGTLPYMSPEQLRALRGDSGEVGCRSDVYSLGVILYEMLSGQLPFTNRHGDRNAVVSEMLTDRERGPIALKAMNRAVSPAVEAIVQRCLSVDVDKRYQSAAELGDDLERQLQSLPLRHTREPSIRERARKWIRRHPKLTSATTVTALAVLLVLGLATTLVVRSQRLARMEAQEAYSQFQSDLRSAQILALDAAAGGKENSAAVIAVCRRGLDRFRIGNNDNWKQASAVRRLPGPLQQDLSRDADELQELMASMTGRTAPPLKITTEPRSLRDECMLACLLSVERRFREALPHWQSATARDPQNLWAWYGLGCCFEQLGEPAQAAACYTACIAIKPDFADWYFHRGVAYLKQRNFSFARADFDRAIALDPARKELLVNRAVAFVGDEQYHAAIDDLLAALNLDPDDSRVYFILAQTREKAGDAQGAKRDRQTGLQCQPSDDLAWVAQGVAKIATDAAGALESFDAALKFNAHCLPALESKAHVLAEKLGRLNDATQVLDRAVELYPEQAGLRAARGVLLARLDHNDAARRDAEEAVSLDASDAVNYQVAGIYALLARHTPHYRSQALRLLASSLRHGYGGDLIASDCDLDAIRNDADFKTLVAASQALAASATDLAQ
jgi:serine/threonine protein kinase/Flp pilus assembly protein TadD